MTRMLLTASIFVLAACGGAPPSSEDVCKQMVEGDAEAAEQISRDGVTVAELCSCLGATVDVKSADEQEKIRAVLYAVSNIREADSIGVEEAAEKLEDVLRSGSGDYDFSENDFDTVGRLLNEIGDQLEDGGTCEAG